VAARGGWRCGCGEGAENARHGAVHVVFGGRIVLEEAHFEQEVRVVFFGGAGFQDGAVGAAVSR